MSKRKRISATALRGCLTGRWWELFSLPGTHDERKLSFHPTQQVPFRVRQPIFWDPSRDFPCERADFFGIRAEVAVFFFSGPYFWGGGRFCFFEPIRAENDFFEKSSFFQKPLF